MAMIVEGKKRKPQHVVEIDQGILHPPSSPPRSSVDSTRLKVKVVGVR